MTSAEPPNGPSKLRATGYGLIGVGAVAAVLGVSTLASAGSTGEQASSAPESPGVSDPGGGSGQPPSGGGDNSAGNPTHDPADPGSGKPKPDDSADGSTGGSPGDSSSGDSPGDSAGQPSGNGDAAGSGAGDANGSGSGDSTGSHIGTGEDRAGAVPVRVLNNSKVRGLADQAGSDFRHAGYDVAEVGNFARDVVPHTTAYFRPGTPEQHQAERIARQFDTRVQPRIGELAGSDPGVIVIVTKDYTD